VEFADGAVERFDAVVGADGVHSAVRRSMFEEGSVYRDPVFAHMVVYRGLVSMEEAVEVFGEKIAKHPTFTMGPGTVLFQYPTDLGRKANMVVMSYQEGPWEEEAWIVPGTRQELESKLQDYGEAGQKWIKVRLPSLIESPGTVY
jgi:salicylate hydroxylase